jgi:hypothetical protein
MNTESNKGANVPQQEDSKWGMIVVLAFALGIPLLGILAKLLR